VHVLTNLVHAADELVDLILAVTSITTLVEVSLLVGPATVGVLELEGPEEGVGVLEVRTAGVDLVNKILHACDTSVTKGLCNDIVAADGDALTVDLSIATLVDQLADGLKVGLTPSDVRSDANKHVEEGLVDTEEGTVVDLAKAQELEDLADLGRDTVGTQDADREDDLGLLRDVELASLLSLALSHDNLTLLPLVLLGVGSCLLHVEVVLLRSGQGSLLCGGGLGSLALSSSLLLLKHGLGGFQLAIRDKYGGHNRSWCEQT